MNNFSQYYADLILNQMIKLKVGEKLSINCTKETAPFAHLLAKEAAALSQVSSLVLNIENGKVDSVDQFDPEGFAAVKEKGVAMVHLSSFSCPEYSQGLELTAPVLQQFSLLSEPIELERRISVPWANIYVPTQRWANFVLGEDANEDQMWLLLADLLSLDDDYNSLFNTQHALLLQRCKKLQSLKLKKLLIECGDSHLECEIAKDTLFSSSASVVQGNRAFFPTLPCEDVVALIDKKSANGTIYTTKPFKLFDTIIPKASFTINNGIVESFDAGEYNALLNRYFNFDKDARKVGQIILCDELTRANANEYALGIPAMDRMRTTCITFGGVDIASLHFKTLEEVEERNINTGFIHLDVPIGSEELQIIGITEDGKKVQLVEDGLFQD